MWLGLVAIGAISSMLFLEWWLSDRVDAVLNADTRINAITGAVLAGLKWAFVVPALDWISGIVNGGWIPLGRLPVFLQLVVVFLVLDWLRWVLHFMHHRVPWLWAFHRVHHSSERLNATSGLRMHVVDFLQLVTIPVIVGSFIFDIRHSPDWLMFACLVPGILLDTFQHANIRVNANLPFWKMWDRLLNNPHFHCWHHTVDHVEHDGNYGQALTIWDRLFGTCVSTPEYPRAIGLDSVSQLRNSELGLQLLSRRK